MPPPLTRTDNRGLYSRFYDAFEPMGEPNIPVDREMMQARGCLLAALAHSVSLEAEKQWRPAGSSHHTHVP